MSILLSRHKVVYLWFVLALQCLSGVVFYQIQNQGLLPGGQMAPIKLAWLMFAIFYWFFIPGFIAADKSLSSAGRWVYRIFLWNMLARAVVELVMMYATQNWHPYYGIGHDFFSVFLLAYLLSVHKPQEAWLVKTTYFIIFMLVVEAYFAYYMLTRVKSDQPVFFVPADDSFSNIFAVTWVMVLASMFFFMYLSWRWARGIRKSC